ncbi:MULTISPECIES: CS1 type fimbrial major subunit [Pseudomonas]|uniref:Adhesin n=2 Tax=Pseudomonas TaxID=286 RepID=A0A0R3ATN6_9PSED|nr:MULTISPECIES: CS1 type fimbrial major subunit [Pseudomonas]AVJ21286.1 adhesin [Pseudomonas sp. MYb193]KRP73995.1 adhesin major subunit pilin [Pseudomonas paralactis]MBC3257188.1 adhesin [Pseudomonas paralactis]MBI6635255.1 adhesin [Pseudomonas paralactis]MBI6655065.1 adhesin [Pseudomonas carnis]
MFKKFAIAVPLAVMALSSSVTAFAAGEASHTVNMKATIPTTVFHAQPRDPNWGRDETMTYNLVSGELAPLSAIYDIKNTNGSVHAYIEGGPAVLFNGDPSQNIPLTTTLNGVTLTGTPQEVVNEADSTPGVGAEMRIVAAKPSATQRGSYTSVMPVVFDAVLPVGP